MSDATLLDALRAALDQDPRNGTLWIHYGQLLDQAGRVDDALEALRNAAAMEAFHDEAARALIPMLRRSGKLDEALIRCDGLLEKADDPELRAELEQIQRLRAAQAGADTEPSEAVEPGEPADPDAQPKSVDEPLVEALASVDSEPGDLREWADQFEWGDLRVTFADVVGLEDVKQQIRLRIIAPFQQPEIYEAFGRDAGGGLLLYGPPGCGKTYIAQATAGELGARFVSVSLHEIVDKYWGESEKFIHALFQEARANTPTVLFFDEFDAIGASRGGNTSAFWGSLVNQLLQEMDGMAGTNSELLVFAATNMPWKVDAAFRRAGRFDRVILVTPPDRAAREELISRLSAKLPGAETIDASKLAKETALFTGADLRALCDRASEAALTSSLDTGTVRPVTQADFDGAVRSMENTSREWLATARNHARYSNEGGRFNELVAYLKRVKVW